MNINDALKKLQDARDALASVLAALDAVLMKVDTPPNAGSLVHTEEPTPVVEPMPTGGQFSA